MSVKNELLLGGCEGTGKAYAQNYARFLDSFRLDVPSGQIILQHPNEALLRVVDLLRSTEGKERVMDSQRAESARFVDVGASKRWLTRKSDQDEP
jgi:hypothetical protein